MTVPATVTISAAVEGSLDEAVVSRLIRNVGGLPGTVYGKNGKPYLRNRISGYNNAARHAPWVVLVDLDAEDVCAPPVRTAWLPDPAPQMCLRFAVQAVEAWLMADTERVAAFIGVARSRVPQDLLSQISRDEILLPEFQRGYVWNKDQVRGLMQSLYRKHPTGHLLIWRTYRPSLVRGGEAAHDGHSLLLLDGQQRLTTLFVLFRGEAPKFYEGESLFFNLHFNMQTEEFRFWQKSLMENNPAWIGVHDFLREGLNALLERLEQVDEAARPRARRVRVLVVPDRELPRDRRAGHLSSHRRTERPPDLRRAAERGQSSICASATVPGRSRSTRWSGTCRRVGERRRRGAAESRRSRPGHPQAGRQVRRLPAEEGIDD